MSDASTLSLDLPEYAEAAYLQYAIAVVKGRALADVRDGLKPVQRRILFAMGQLGLQHPAKHVKSARVVGDVLGKYHPHGDQSVYDALVRMAQPFTLRYPLVDGQGNFGSLDGDSAAAMRYTEARLTPLAQVLLSELHGGTVDFVDNYDGSFQEPALTPARLPMLLLNGTSGIAVGMAADCPSHNLREVANAAALVLREPTATLDDVLSVLPGPDFPGGGQLVASPSEIRAAYEQGRGSLRCRAKWKREDLARGQWQMVVHELPFQVSTRKILEELDGLTNPKPPAGKKSITQQQANLKAVALDLIERAADESDKDSGIRLVIAPRNSKVDETLLVNFLLANTSLEANASLNLTVIGGDGRPATKGILTVLQEWSNFRTAVVERRTRFELAGTEKRIHLLEGRHIAFLNLEAVIRVIRDADEPKPELMSNFKLSEVQAENILEMRLRQLNRLEGFKLEQDLAAARAEADRLKFLLENPLALRDLVVSEIEAVGAQFGDDRRTQIAPSERITAAAKAPAVLDEPLTVVVTKGLWVKSFKGHGLAPDTLTVKTSDTAQFVVETTAAKPVVVLDSAGRAYAFAASAVPGGRGEGAPLSTLMELQAGALPVAVLGGGLDDRWAFSTSEGFGFISALKNLVARPRAGKAFLAVGTGATVMPPVPVPTPVSGYFVCVNSQSRMLCFGAGELKELGGGKGVVLQDLDEGLQLTRFWHVPEAAFSVQGLSKSGKQSTFAIKGEAWQKHLSKRGRKGCYLPNKEVIV